MPILQKLGKDHVPRDVVAEHYPIVGQALLETLEAGLGDKWTPQLKTAWSTAYKVISDTMIGDDTLDATKIKLIRESWEAAMTLGDTNVGVLLFKNIFTIAPGALQLFSFKDTRNLYENPKFKNHAKKVVNTVGVAVGLIDNLEELVPILQELGKTHVPRDVLPEHYPIVGQALLDTLEAGLGDKCTP